MKLFLILSSQGSYFRDVKRRKNPKEKIFGWREGGRGKKIKNQEGLLNITLKGSTHYRRSSMGPRPSGGPLVYYHETIPNTFLKGVLFSRCKKKKKPQRKKFWMEGGRPWEGGVK